MELYYVVDILGFLNYLLYCTLGCSKREYYVGYDCLSGVIAELVEIIMIGGELGVKDLKESVCYKRF